MITKITRQVKDTTKQDFIKQYSKEVKKVDEMKKAATELAEIQAKHPADIYIVAEFEEGQVIPEMEQGDILIWREGCRQYNKYINSVANLEEAKTMNLQLGEAITGDHKVVPLANSNLTIEDCTIEVQLPKKANSWRSVITYPAKIIKADKAFCIVHREHGNITLPSGTYMTCVALNPKTLSRMID